MVTFKGEWGKLYYTQHTLLSKVRQLLILFFFEKQTHIHKPITIIETLTLLLKFGHVFHFKN